MATIFYARVSTVDQNIEHQQAQAEAAGFKIARVVADHGVSGVSTLFAERPNGKRLFDILREGDTLLVRWVDRLGRNYSDVRDTIQEFMRRGVVVRTVINGLTFDGATSDPMQQAVRDALIGFLAATAQANAEAIKEAQRGGIALAKANYAKTKYRGRKPSFTRSQLSTVCNMLDLSKGIGEIAATTGLSRQTIYRIRDDRASAEAALASWAA
ncbi:recombinase family protein [Bradyrhizobium sp. JYMT SZCCT0428]|uniref:recombinase family protein n=1 Tax=Bradyrhizobium sp. JYMT SZCCT0428 TaxID=2807673 RepID=UPI001BA692DD|nr:recombinase family protein [Bradyrhizobium sp. JYMT SZCCT0428]MBR1154392.1 recombinase family protein [Bradyrhizobium sp. JYMT SZCCT0428]